MVAWKQRLSLGRIVRALSLIGLLAIVAVAALPLRDPRFFRSHDGFEHVFRVLAFTSALRQGDILPRWVPELAGGFGYPLFFLYSPLSYYVPALLALAHVPLLTAIKLDIVLLVGASAAGAYFAIRALYCPLPALVGAAAYACAPYTLANIYLRLDLAELSAFPLTAWALAALFWLARELRIADKVTAPSALRYGGVAAAMFALVAATHSLSLIIFIPVVTPVGLWIIGGGRPTIFQIVRRTAFLGCVAFLSACLGAWFLLPAIQWQGWVRLSAIPDDSHFYVKLIDAPGMLVSALHSERWFIPQGSLWFLSFASGPSAELLAGPAYASLMAALAAPCVAVFRRSERRGVIFALMVGLLVCITLMSRWSEPFWAAVPRLTQIQFPWRFMGPISLLVALLSAAFVGELPRKTQSLVAGFLLAATLVPSALLVEPMYQGLEQSNIVWPTQLRREFHKEFGTTGTGLFLPQTVRASVPGDVPPVEYASQVVPDSLTIESLALNRMRLSLDYAAGGPRTFTVGRIMAPAWRAQVDGADVHLGASSWAGLQQVKLPAGSHHLQIALQPTAMGMVGEAISIFATALLVFVLFVGDRIDRRGLIMPLAMTCCIVALFVLAGPALSWVRFDRSPWMAPAKAPDGMVADAVGWRMEERPDWAQLPVAHVAFLVHRSAAPVQSLAIRLSTAEDTSVWEANQEPRFGNYDVRAWISGLFFDDYLLLPSPNVLCGGDYHLEIGWTVSPTMAPPMWQRLGTITLPGLRRDGCAAPARDRSSSGPAALVTSHSLFTVLGAPAPTVQAGDELDVRLDLRILKPTEDDERLRIQITDGFGREVVHRDSDPSVDLDYTSLWKQRGMLRYDTALTLPRAIRPGIYRVRVGLIGEDQKGFTSNLADVEGETTADHAVDLQPLKVVGPRLLKHEERAVFGGSLGLIGAGISDPGTREVAPGATLHVAFRWDAVKLPDADYTLFLQLLDAQGKLVAQQDGPPLDGTYPTSTWDVGSVIDDPRDLTIPPSLPAGTYRLLTGWYRPTTGQRLKADPPQPADALEIATIHVGT